MTCARSASVSKSLLMVSFLACSEGLRMRVFPVTKDRIPSTLSLHFPPLRTVAVYITAATDIVSGATSVTGSIVTWNGVSFLT
ncbi:hypothetical protein B0I73DRAFT_20235 [Yarrowia lipolytica]|nr:hypothetical protein B0I73DRAFT_20235 [Yarrowia lipolytica]